MASSVAGALVLGCPCRQVYANNLLGFFAPLDLICWEGAVSAWRTADCLRVWVGFVEAPSMATRSPWTPAGAGLFKKCGERVDGVSSEWPEF